MISKLIKIIYLYEVSPNVPNVIFGGNFHLQEGDEFHVQKFSTLLYSVPHPPPTKRCKLKRVITWASWDTPLSRPPLNTHNTIIDIVCHKGIIATAWWSLLKMDCHFWITEKVCGKVIKNIAPLSNIKALLIMSTTPERPKAVVLYNPLPLSYSIHFIFSPESFKEYSELLTILERNRNIDERKTWQM